MATLTSFGRKSVDLRGRVVSIQQPLFSSDEWIVEITLKTSPELPNEVYAVHVLATASTPADIGLHTGDFVTVEAFLYTGNFIKIVSDTALITNYGPDPEMNILENVFAATAR